MDLGIYVNDEACIEPGLDSRAPMSEDLRQRRASQLTWEVCWPRKFYLVSGSNGREAS